MPNGINDVERAEIKNRAINLILANEGRSFTCKFDNKQWSWGYGTSCDVPGATITKAKAREYFVSHMTGNFEKAFSLNGSLSSDEYVGIISFLYNAGNHTNVNHYISKGDVDSVKYLMSLYINAGSIYENGLRKRRGVEIGVMNGSGLF